MPSELLGTRYLVSMYRGASNTWKWGNQPVYRAYNPNSGLHFFTTNASEYHMLGRAGWRCEGVAFRLTGSGTVNVYRVYNPNSGQHLFTLSSSERDSLVKLGWRSEGIAWKADDSGNLPVYRLYNKNSGEHFYTASAFEYAALGKAGWSQEGVAWYSYAMMCLDTAADSQADGVNVQTGQLDFSASQAWQVYRQTDGTYKLVNRQTGKCLDLQGGTLADGANVQQWTDNGSRAQSWVSQAVGTTTSILGGTVDVVRLLPSGSSTLALSTAQNVVGGNAQVKTLSTSDLSQQWALIDASDAIVDGSFEIRLKADTRYALDVVAGSKANGANVQIYSANGTNAQKWWLNRGNDGYTLVNVETGKYADVSGGAFRDGQNVHQWADNSARNQRWKLELNGQTTVGGRPCAVVSIGAGNSSDYRLAATSTGNSANVYITNQSLDDDQLWVLYPCDGSDPTLPVPSNVSLADSVGGTETGVRSYADRHYPTWTCPDAWLAGDNHYQWRWRKRVYTNSWGTWTDWVQWADAPVTVRDDRAWVTDGVDTSYDKSYAQGCEIEIQVLVVGQSDWGMAHGGTADAVCRCISTPTVTIGKCGVGPDGITLDYTSDLSWGTRVYIKSMRSGGRAVISGERSFGPLDSHTSLVIPLDSAEYVLRDGDGVQIEYQVGCPIEPRVDTVHRATLTASWQTGSVDVTPVVTVNQDRTITVQVPHLGSEALWVDFGDHADGEIEVTPTVVDGKTTWEHAVDYPFRRDFTIYVKAVSSDGDKWGVGYRAVSKIDAILMHWAPCHKFTWFTQGADGSWHINVFLVEMAEGSKIVTSRTVNHDATESQIAGRENRVVTYTRTTDGKPTKKGAYEVDGVLMNSVSYSDLDQLKAMADQGYVHYSAPNGDSSDVAITGYSYESTKYLSTVNISMTEVGGDGD